MHLIAWGHAPPVAAAIAGLLGVLSVAGRLLTTGLTRRRPVTTVTAAVFVVQAAAAGALPIVGATTAGTISTVIGCGLGFGVVTIARPALLAESYDTCRYATLAGVLTVPITVAKAAAPLTAAALQTATGSYTPVLAPWPGAAPSPPPRSCGCPQLDTRSDRCLNGTGG